MKLRTLITALLVTAASMGTALAEQRTVILTVENMTCAICPVTVKAAMSELRRCPSPSARSDRRHDERGIPIALGV